MLVLWVAPYSLFFILYSLFFTPPYSSLLLLILLIPLIPPYSSLFLLPPFCKPPYNSDMKRVSCSENVNFVR